VSHRRSNAAVADAIVLDHSGTVVMEVHGYECVLDSSLNAAFVRRELGAGS
jgi:hypothetical protein